MKASGYLFPDESVIVVPMRALAVNPLGMTGSYMNLSETLPDVAEAGCDIVTCDPLSTVLMTVPAGKLPPPAGMPGRMLAVLDSPVTTADAAVVAPVMATTRAATPAHADVVGL